MKNSCHARSDRPRGARRLAMLGVLALLLSVQLGAMPAAAAPQGTGASPAGTDQAAVLKAPSVTVVPADDTSVVKPDYTINADYTVLRMETPYWGRIGYVEVRSGEVRLGVTCTGWPGLVYSQWLQRNEPGSIWRVIIDCGSFIPATSHVWESRG